MTLRKHLAEHVGSFMDADDDVTVEVDYMGDILCREEDGLIAVGADGVDLFVEWCRKLVAEADRYNATQPTAEPEHRPELVALERRVAQLEERIDAFNGDFAALEIRLDKVDAVHYHTACALRGER